MVTASHHPPFPPSGPEKPTGVYRTPALLVALGALSILLFIWVHRDSERQAAEVLDLEDAVHHLELAVSTSHLWLEEYLAGDASIDIDEVWRNLDLSIEQALTLLDDPAAGTARTSRLRRDPLLRLQVGDLKDRMLELRNLSVERYRRGIGAGVGTEMDQSFDRIFDQVLGESEALRGALVKRSRQLQTRAHRRLGLVAGTWAVIVLAAAVALWRRERRRRTAEAGLQTSLRWLSTTMSSIADAVIATDALGAVTLMNPMAEKLTGWPLAEALGRPVEGVLTLEEDDGTPVANPVVTVLGSGESIVTSRRTVMADRQREECYGVEGEAAPMRDRGGRLLGAVLVFRDVSQRRQTEEALRQREAELHHSQKMEAIGRLAGGIAHDINNYLGAIRGYCEVARMNSGGDPAQIQRLDAAMDTAAEASDLIRRLLAFSRRRQVEAENVDVNRVVAKMEGLLRQLLGDDVDLETRCGSGVWSVEADPSQIEQILINLLVNSRDAMPRGGKIVVTTRNLEKRPDDAEPTPALAPGCYAVLSVADTGAGIPSEVQKRIFEPFFTTKPESGSSGLGLATVYGIVKQNGGFIHVDSRPGEGTTFDVYLLACEGPADWHKAPAAPSPATRRSASGGAKVLLVEDHDPMRDSTAGLLRALGHQVLTAADGDEALRLLTAEAPDLDLLIIDVVMPGLSGPELFGRIREQRPELPCLFVSGHSEGTVPDQDLDQDRTDFLQKPFTARNLSVKIAEILGRRARASAAG